MRTVRLPFGCCRRGMRPFRGISIRKEEIPKRYLTPQRTVSGPFEMSIPESAALTLS